MSKMKAQHITSKAAAENIWREGFKPTSKGFGGIWGEGIYAALDAEAIRFYALGISGKAEVLDLEISVENPLEIDVSAFEYPDEVFGPIVGKMGLENEFATELAEIEGRNRAIDASSGIVVRATSGRYEQAVYREAHGFCFDPEGTALGRVARAAGYDAIVIRDSHFRAGMGGDQIVVFDSENIKVI
jgi:hypothetical protein